MTTACASGPLKDRTGCTPWLSTRSMPVSMTGKIEQVEVITSVQRRRRWSAEEKATIVQETYAPGMSVSLVAPARHCAQSAVHALIRRRRQQQGGGAVNVKRVYRIMKVHGLLLERHTGAGEERRHDGRVAVNRPDTRWCSDGFEIGCDNGERVRIAFTLDCCDREAISWVATTGAIN